VAEDVPDAESSAVFIPGALDLIGCGCGTPNETFFETHKSLLTLFFVFIII
jgi:hypothetical protein